MTTKTKTTKPESATKLDLSKPMNERFAAVSLTFIWQGVKKAVSDQQKEKAADTFNANSRYVTMLKTLINTKAPSYKAVMKARHRIEDIWGDRTEIRILPFPISGIRLIPRDQVQLFVDKVEDLRKDLKEAVKNLSKDLPDLKARAKERLGRLYNEADYPESFEGSFDVQYEFVSIEPPNYLMSISPKLYEAEKARIVARFEEAQRLAVDAFTVEFAKLIKHLSEKLGNDKDGTPMVFRDSTVGNLTEFFDKIKGLGVTGGTQLDALVEQAKKALNGVSPEQLREAGQMRENVSKAVGDISDKLDKLMVEAPRRKVLRPTKPEAKAA